MRRLFYGLLPCIAAAVLLAVFIAGRWPLWQQALYSDESPASWLSSAQLLAGAFAAMRIARAGELPRAWAASLAIALWIMALDEQFMLHERWKHGCERWWSACDWEVVREGPTWLIAIAAASPSPRSSGSGATTCSTR